MRIAVIGGGAAGIVTCHLLGGVHDVTLFEREPVLGGNIRTLGRNVRCDSLVAGLHVDAGVIEFERDRFPAFHALMEDLGVALGVVPGTSALFLADGRSYLSPGDVRHTTKSRLRRARALIQLLPLARSRHRFLRRTAGIAHDELVGSPLSRYLDADAFSLWARLLVMYAYSIPAPQVGDAPAALAVPMLRDFLSAGRWTRIEGGVYTYVERILERFPGVAHADANVARVRRRSDGVDVQMADGARLAFDAVVFATTPDQVLALLADPSEPERRRFAAWEPQPATTVVHTDETLYRRHGIHYPSEFDLFETTSGRHGYNAYLNRLAGLDDAEVAYQLAFGLEEEIDPARIVHVQHHVTPRYTVAAFRHRDEVAATNGERRTFHAGAYLGDGLHEGAVRSACAVSALLGGQRIRGWTGSPVRCS